MCSNNLQRQKKQILQKLKLDLLIDFIFCGYIYRGGKKVAPKKTVFLGKTKNDYTN